jgi:ABC-type ATPase involved in cell division
MDEQPAILEFRAASLNPPDQPENRLCDVSLVLPPGAAAVVRMDVPAHFRETHFDYFPLADAAQGLLPCADGQVFFRGLDWAALGPMEQARNRGRIGRLFDFHGWVYNLPVMENLLLACRTLRYRGGAPKREAEEMARRFGLEGVPEGRPVLLRKREQRLFEWVRAFLCQPDLVILERPEMDMPRLALDVCFDLAREARGRGAAILWITEEDDMVERILKTDAAPFTVRGRTWRAGRI